MSSADLYKQIYTDNIEYIKSGNIEIDDVLAAGKHDLRRGISLIIPIRKIHDSYKRLVGIFSDADANQYYYPFEDLHITIFDFIQGRNDFQRNILHETDFLEIAGKAVKSIGPLRIKMEGVVFSRGAGLIKGYDNDKLVSIRKNIRDLLVNSLIKNDERYESESAHITFCRFRTNLLDPQKFYEAIEKTKDIDIGEEEITHAELVEHDWYNTSVTKRVVERFWVE